MARHTCTMHCSDCGPHFHSLAAFDAHLHRISEGVNQHGARTYEPEHLDGADVGLEAWTHNGHCDLAWPHVSRVTVWQIPMTEQRAQQLAALQAQRADSDNTVSRSGQEIPSGVSGDLVA
jgi:hypothetical protein